MHRAVNELFQLPPSHRKYEPPALVPISPAEMATIRLDEIEARTRDLEYIAWGLLGFFVILFLFGRR